MKVYCLCGTRPRTDLDNIHSAYDDFDKAHEECERLMNAEHDTDDYFIHALEVESECEWHMLTDNPEDIPPKYTLVILCIQGHDVIKCMDGESIEDAISRINKIRYPSCGFWTEEGWCGADGYPMMVRPIAWKYIDEPHFKED